MAERRGRVLLLYLLLLLLMMMMIMMMVLKNLVQDHLALCFWASALSESEHNGVRMCERKQGDRK